MIQEVFHTYLKNHFIYSKLTDEQVKFVYPFIRYKLLKKGQQLFSKDSNNHLSLVLNGKMKLIDCNDPENFFIKDLLYSGDFFGDVTLSYQNQPGEFVQALVNNTLVCSCPVQKVRELITVYPELALLFASYLGYKLKAIQRRYTIFANRDARERLIHFFKTSAKAEGKIKDGKILLEHSLTINEISDFIAVSRQTVYTLLKQLKASNHIDWKRDRIEVCPSLFQPAHLSLKGGIHLKTGGDVKNFTSANDRAP